MEPIKQRRGEVDSSGKYFLVLSVLIISLGTKRTNHTLVEAIVESSPHKIGYHSGMECVVVMDAFFI